MAAQQGGTATAAHRGDNARPGRTGGVVWPAYLASVWMVLFAAFHAYWAFGGTFGLPPGESLVDNTPLFIIDIIAIPMNLGGAALALALVQPWGRRFPRWMPLWAGWFGAVLMSGHALPAMVDLAVYLLGQRDEPLEGLERFSILVYEPYWMLGGLLFAAATWNFQRQTRPPAGER